MKRTIPPCRHAAIYHWTLQTAIRAEVKNVQIQVGIIKWFNETALTERLDCEDVA